MANEEQLSILKQGVEVWNKWRHEHFHTKIDLSNAELTEFYLVNANFMDANLYGINLSGSDLSTAVLRRANLNKANLKSSKLLQANLINASLVQASLIEANLIQANLFQTDLSNAYFEKAAFGYANLYESILCGTNFIESNVGGTFFSRLDLSKSFGLENIFHDSPSTIGTDTIQLSKGKIPEAFLRGCGLSDIEIEFAKLSSPGLDPEQVTNITYKIHQLYLGEGIQYYSCFISYSSKDEEFAKCLHDDLQNNGVRCWFDREDIKIGDKIRTTIDRQIRLRDKLLIILSENSIKSEYVGDEVEAALEEENKSERLVLFPIRLDDRALNTRDDWAAKIKRRRHIGDFSNWKDKASYQKAFERLLRDLKATSE